MTEKSKDIKDPQAVYTYLYDSNREGAKYGSGPVGTLYKWVKDKLVSGNLVDLCCGHGMFGNYEKDREYTGVDFAITAIEQNRIRFPNKTFKVFDMAKDYPVGNNEFDNVVCCDAMEHFYEDDLPNVLNNIKSCCKTTSKIFLSISCRPSSGWEYEGTVYDLHLTVWPPAQWLTYLKDNGFEIIDSEVIGSAVHVECKLAEE